MSGIPIRIKAMQKILERFMNNYKEEKILGKGNFGSATLCTNLSTSKKVVIKTLDKRVGSKQLKSFEKEVAAMCLLDHPNIIKYIDSFEDEENSQIVMEYADGGDLQKLIENGAVDELVGVKSTEKRSRTRT